MSESLVGKLELVLEICKRIYPRGENLTDQKVTSGEKGLGKKNFWHRI